MFSVPADSQTCPECQRRLRYRIETADDKELNSAAVAYAHVRGGEEKLTNFSRFIVKLCALSHNISMPFRSRPSLTVFDIEMWFIEDIRAAFG